MSAFPTRRNMQKRMAECAASFNVWTARGTWFWSLVYPGRLGGAIGAAPSQSEALGEAKAAIERLQQAAPKLDSTKRSHAKWQSRQSSTVTVQSRRHL